MPTELFNHILEELNAKFYTGGYLWYYVILIENDFEFKPIYTSRDMLEEIEGEIKKDYPDFKVSYIGFVLDTKEVGRAGYIFDWKKYQEVWLKSPIVGYEYRVML